MILFRAELRHRWRSWLLLSLLVALVSGIVLAGVVAGRRTATAFPRYVQAHGYDDFGTAKSLSPRWPACPA
jgi:putative ABC transport system permease protein